MVKDDDGHRGYAYDVQEAYGENFSGVLVGVVFNTTTMATVGLTTTASSIRVVQFNYDI